MSSMFSVGRRSRRSAIRGVARNYCSLPGAAADKGPSYSFLAIARFVVLSSRVFYKIISKYTATDDRKAENRLKSREQGQGG